MSARRLISLFRCSIGLLDQIFCQCPCGNAVDASTSVLASRIMAVTLGNDSAKVAVIWSHCSATSSGSVWAKIVVTAAVTAGACFGGYGRVQVTHVMYPAPLPRGSGELLRHRRFQTCVSIGDGQVHPGQTTRL